MTFHIDIALDLRKEGKITHYKRIVVGNAEKNNCVDYYGNYEMYGRGRTITRNHYVLSFTFPDTENHLIRFMQFVKQETPWQIEMIGYEHGKYELLYASRKYLTLMEAEMARKYIKQRKILKIGEHKNIVIEAVK